jgi:hypothetical protein
MYYSTGAEIIATFSDEKIGLYSFAVSSPPTQKSDQQNDGDRI